MKVFCFNISYFHRFASNLWSFEHFLVTKKRMAWIYNRWCQHFFTFHILWIYCLTIVLNYIDIRLVLREIWRWGQIDPPPLPPFPTTEKSYSQKNQTEIHETWDALKIFASKGDNSAVFNVQEKIVSITDFQIDF